MELKKYQQKAIDRLNEFLEELETFKFNPRKAFISSSAVLIDSKPQRAKAISGVCTLVLLRSTTEDAKVNFYLNFNDGTNYHTIVFDPITIPNQSSVDLSTLLSVVRG